MILPIYSYGHAVLKKLASPIDKDYDHLATLIENMWETMYQAKGVGLAAPQIGQSIRLFIVDTVQLERDSNAEEGIKKVFINPQILVERGDEWNYEEGCLSIPTITGEVSRNQTVTIRFQDEAFDSFEEIYSGMNARVIQHEYDHLEGILFTDRLKPLKKRLISRKLESVKRGKVEVGYRMKFRL